MSQALSSYSSYTAWELLQELLFSDNAEAKGRRGSRSSSFLLLAVTEPLTLTETPRQRFLVKPESSSQAPGAANL